MPQNQMKKRVSSGTLTAAEASFDPRKTWGKSDGCSNSGRLPSTELCLRTGVSEEEPTEIVG